ncbi:NAD(P)-dependent oxidoreductase [Alcaligenaceae bacterium]|nr:NAD(P)-dependent oxidoreductase [Alcaligenaceae bacterium]
MSVIAFVGLGSMGLPMATNLLLKGHEVRGVDLDKQSCAAFIQAGGSILASAAEATRDADMLIVMVVNAQQAEQILTQPDVLSGLKSTGIVCVMATCQPAAMRHLNTLVQSAGRRFIDAPVSGGVVGAESGTLTIMAATEQACFEEAAPVLKQMGERLFHVGEQPGQGAMVKAVNQLLCGVHIAVTAEAFSLAAKADINPELLLEIMSGSAASSWMLRDRGPRMLQDNPAVSSAVDIFVKDLDIVLSAGKDVKAALPLAAAAYQMFLTSSGRGDGRADDSQVIRSYQVLNGTSLTSQPTK